jgi:hypothetical protein
MLAALQTKVRHIARVLSLAIMFVLNYSSGIAHAAKVDSYIPTPAVNMMPLVINVINSTWSDIPNKEYIPSLIEVESCISLTHSRCWNTKSELRTKRERGVGLGQITVAYKGDGSVRFDALQDNKRLDNRLKDLNWNNVADRADLQIIMITRMVESAYKRLKPIVGNQSAALDMADSAYNGGLGGVLNARTLCSLTKGCNPNIWFGNVEKTCAKSKKPMPGYGGRSPCDINIDHVIQTRLVRPAKYKALIEAINKKTNHNNNYE